VATNSGDAVFLVRLRRSESPEPHDWRGSVYEVATGRRFYVSNGRDVSDFIDARLADISSTLDLRAD
jgi:hypothetical protein